MFEEKLIAAVRKNPCLYDKRLSEYKNIIKKSQVWEAISDNLNVPASSCKSRWKSLRDRFCRENWKQQSLPSDEHNWQFYNSLTFLKNHLAPKRSSYLQKSNDLTKSDSFVDELVMEANFKVENERISNDDVFGDIIEYTDEHVKISPPVSPVPSKHSDKYNDSQYRKRKYNQCTSENEDFKRFFSKLDTLLESKIKPSETNKNHDAFLELLAMKLDKFPENEQEDIKMEILISVHEKYKQTKNS